MLLRLFQKSLEKGLTFPGDSGILFFVVKQLEKSPGLVYGARLELSTSLSASGKLANTPSRASFPPSPPKQRIYVQWSIDPFVFLFLAVREGEGGNEAEAVVNDSPVGCQSRDLARPQADRIPPSPPRSPVNKAFAGVLLS